MKQLTHEDAERFARACEYKKEYNVPIGGPSALGVGIGIDTFVKKTRWRKDKEIIPDISLDPYFWRPRLEDRLYGMCEGMRTKKELVWMEIYSHDITVKVRKYYVDHDYEESIVVSGDHSDFCPALCEAIEQLTKE